MELVVLSPFRGRREKAIRPRVLTTLLLHVLAVHVLRQLAYSEDLAVLSLVSRCSARAV